MEFLLHNEDGIQFPPIRPSFRIGDHYFDRFCCLIPRDKDTSVLGQGGAGVVHLARDEVMDRLIALKLLNKELQNDPMARLDVIRETRQAMDLTHPNIVRIHDFHEGPEGWGISMQYIDGLDLDKWRIENSAGSSSIIPYPVERIENWIRQLCDALAYAHDDARMVHRDIKPRNLMLERRDDGHEKLYLTDFGITKKLATHTLMVSKIQPAARDEKAALGTLPYMSWQQLEDEAPTIYDDIYSVGATIYDLITGRPPFYEGSYDQIRHQIENGTPPSMGERLEAFSLPNPGIPKAWEEVVGDCLLKDPAARPASAREIAERLGLARSAPAIVPTRDTNRESELENEIAAQHAKLEEATAHQAKLEEVTAQKDELIDSLNQELADLRAIVAKDGGVNDSLQTELAQLQQKIALREEEVATLRKDLEDAQNNARLEGNEALSALQDTIRQKDDVIDTHKKELAELRESIASEETASEALQGQLATLQETIKLKEEEVLSLQSDLGEVRRNAELESDEALKALQESIRQRDDEIAQLKSASGNRQAELDEALRAADSNLAKLNDLEAKLQAARAENAGATQQINEAREAANAERSQREQEVAKARQIAEQAKAKFNDLKDKKSAPLIPVFITLIASLIFGLGGGAILGKFLHGGGKESSENLTFDFEDHEDAIPTKGGKEGVGGLVTAGLFKQFARDTGVREQDFDLLVSGLSTMDDYDHVNGVSYPMAESFCAWLTTRNPLGAISEESTAFYRIPGIDELPDGAGKEFPEWTSSPYFIPNKNGGSVTGTPNDANSPLESKGGVDAKQITPNPSITPTEPRGLMRTWTKTFDNQTPASVAFRVILDDGEQ